MIERFIRPFNGYPVYYGVVMGLCKVIDGLTLVVTLGYWYADIELIYLCYENKRLMERKCVK